MNAAIEESPLLSFSRNGGHDNATIPTILAARGKTSLEQAMQYCNRMIRIRIPHVKSAVCSVGAEVR